MYPLVTLILFALLSTMVHSKKLFFVLFLSMMNSSKNVNMEYFEEPNSSYKQLHDKIIYGNYTTYYGNFSETVLTLVSTSTSKRSPSIINDQSTPTSEPSGTTTDQSVTSSEPPSSSEAPGIITNHTSCTTEKTVISLEETESNTNSRQSDPPTDKPTDAPTNEQETTHPPPPTTATTDQSNTTSNPLYTTTDKSVTSSEETEPIPTSRKPTDAPTNEPTDPPPPPTTITDQPTTTSNPLYTTTDKSVTSSEETESVPTSRKPTDAPTNEPTDPPPPPTTITDQPTTTSNPLYTTTDKSVTSSEETESVPTSRKPTDAPTNEPTDPPPPPTTTTDQYPTTSNPLYTTTDKSVTSSEETDSIPTSRKPTDTPTNKPTDPPPPPTTTATTDQTTTTSNPLYTTTDKSVTSSEKTDSIPTSRKPTDAPTNKPTDPPPPTTTTATTDQTTTTSNPLYTTTDKSVTSSEKTESIPTSRKPTDAPTNVPTDPPPTAITTTDQPITTSEETESTNTTDKNGTTDSLSTTTTRPTTIDPTDYNYNCPDGLNLFASNHSISELNKTIICYQITNPVRYDDVTCPFSGNVFDATIYQSLYESEVIFDSTWITATRNTSLSPFILEYIENFNPLENLIESSETKNCLIYFKDDFYLEDCGAQHKMLCLYIFNEYGCTDHCCLMSSSNQTTSADMKSERCYTIETSINNSGKLAEPKEYYQWKKLFFLWKKFYSFFDDYCRVGVEMQSNRTVFTSSKETVEYADKLDLKPKNGSYGYMSYSVDMVYFFGVIYSNYAIETEVSFRTGKPTITLVFNELNIIGTVLNFENIFGLRLYCKFGDKMFRTYENYNVQLNSKQFTAQPKYTYPHYFWCQAIDVKSNSIIESNSVLVYIKNKYGRDYVINKKFSSLNEIYTALVNINQKFSNIPCYVEDSVRLVDVTKDGNNYAANIHISTYINDTISSTEEVKIFNEVLKEVIDGDFTIYNSLNCLEDTEINQNVILTWPETPIGSTVTAKSSTVCVTDSYKAVTRKCTGDFNKGATWSSTSGSCSTKSTETTKNLHNILESANQTSGQIGKKLSAVTENMTKDIHPVDIDYIAKIMNKISTDITEDLNLPDIYNTLANIILIDRNTLSDSQTELNSTDNILYNFDNILLNTYKDSEQSPFVRNGELLITVLKSNLQRVAGWKVLANRTIREIQRNTSLTKLLESDDFEIAAFLPDAILHQIENMESDSKLIMTFFFRNSLFNPPTSNIDVKDIFVSILLTNFSVPFDESVYILFKLHDLKFVEDNCAFWKYGFDDKLEAIKGNWATMQNSSMNISDSNYQICHYNHLTHFGLLITSASYGDLMNDILGKVTIVGSALSAVGATIIIVTAIIFKKWRNVKFNITQLNFLISTLFTSVCLFLADYVSSGAFCITVAVLLHYSLIAQFCWMFIMSYLAYKKYVIIFNPQIRNLKQKAYFGGWFLPTVPIIVICTINVQEYSQNESGICFLEDLYFKLFVLLPAGVILLLNLLFYILIIVNLTLLKPLQKTHPGERNRILRVISLLTFQMGIMWIFGLILTFNNNLIIAYLFTIGCSFQGFFVAMGHFLMGQTKKYWIDSIRWKIRESVMTETSSYSRSTSTY